MIVVESNSKLFNTVQAMLFIERTILSQSTQFEILYVQCTSLGYHINLSVRYQQDLVLFGWITTACEPILLTTSKSYHNKIFFLTWDNKIHYLVQICCNSSGFSSFLLLSKNMPLGGLVLCGVLCGSKWVWMCVCVRAHTHKDKRLTGD